MTHDIRKFMNLMEQAQINELDLTPTKAEEPEDKEDLPLDQLGRDEEGRAQHDHITMTQDKDKVVAQLTHYESGRYTNLAKKVLRIKQLSAEIKTLEEDVKAGARTDIADLFGAKDIAFTRVVETRSFILQLTKDPKPTNTVAYAKVLTELETHLTPELIAVLETIKKKFTSTVTKAPALSVVAKESVIEEGAWDRIKEVLARLKATIESWATSYDEQLGALRLSVGMTANVAEARVDEISDELADRAYNARLTQHQAQRTQVKQFAKSADFHKQRATHGGINVDKEAAAVDYKQAKGELDHFSKNAEITGTRLGKNANLQQGRIAKQKSKLDQHNLPPNSGAKDAAEYDALDAKSRQISMRQPVGETVDYSRIDRIEKQVEFMAKAGRLRAYIVANIAEKMGAEEAEYAADYFDQNCSHMAVAEAAAAEKKVTVAENTLYGFKYLKEEADEEESGDEADDELSEDDLGENMDPLVREFDEFMGGNKAATMAFKNGSTVYCGSRSGVVKGLVPNKPDTLLVELPSGEMDAFPMAKTSDKKPGLARRATQWVMGEDAAVVNESDDGMSQDDASALYMLLGLVVPNADIYTPGQVDPGTLSVGIEGDEVISQEKFNVEILPGLKAAFAQVGATITQVNFDEGEAGEMYQGGHLELHYTGKVNSSVYMKAFGAKVQEYFESPMEELDLDLDAWAAAGAAPATGATPGQAIGAAMNAMLRGQYDGWGVKRDYLYIDLKSMYGDFSDRDGDRVAAALNKALAPFGVSVAYDHMGSSGFAFEIMSGEL